MGNLNFSCSEPIISTAQQPKKREHTDLTEGSGSDDGHNPHKIVKKESKGQTAPSVQRSSASLPDKEAELNVQMKSGDPVPTVVSNCFVHNCVKLVIEADISLMALEIYWGFGCAYKIVFTSRIY